ncbi:MAG: rpe [Herbinix sp.]|jgi:ribulose-phosphate 3-epimerase|nr:rpe [Herbinix sp.]
MNMIKLAPSILAADFTKLGEQITLLESTGVEYLHIDVMDGKFVPSISFGMPVIASIRKNSKLIFDVHLMIEDPDKYLEAFKASGADILTVHAETCTHLHRTLSRIRELGMKAGVSLNPATPIHVLEHVMDELDMVLIMSVNPGFGGQVFLPSMLQKIESMREMIAKNGNKIDIEVDGGITSQNVEQVIKAGANIIVAGTSVFKGDMKENVTEFQDKFQLFN